MRPVANTLYETWEGLSDGQILLIVSKIYEKDYVSDTFGNIYVGPQRRAREFPSWAPSFPKLPGTYSLMPVACLGPVASTDQNFAYLTYLDEPLLKEYHEELRQIFNSI